METLKMWMEEVKVDVEHGMNSDEPGIYYDVQDGGHDDEAWAQLA